MKLIYFTLVICFSRIVYSQTYTSQSLFYDSFLDNNNGWSTVSLNENQYETYISKSAKYICRLPNKYRKKKNWNWTWVGFPNDLETALNSNQNIEFSFDWQVLETDDYNGFLIALMFDTHNVKGECLGGDFKAIWVEGDVNQSTITPYLRQTENCNSGELFRNSGSSVSYMPKNSFRMVKTGNHYNIFINSKSVLSFDFLGKINCDHLLFGQGTYAFDNFAVTKKTIVQNIPIPSNTIVSVPKIWAVISGVEKYKDDYCEPLTNIIKDANDMYSFYRSNNGGRVPMEQLSLITDEYATASNILSEVNKFSLKANNNDILIVYLSGHGGSGFFYGYDKELDYKELNTILNNSNAKNKLVIVDACKSGSLKDRTIYKEGGGVLSTESKLTQYYNSLLTAGTGVTYLLSSQANEKSQVGTNNSIFTSCLLNGLNGGAEASNDGIITIEEIFKYIRNEIPKYAPRQHPVLLPESYVNLPLAIRID